MEFQPRTQKEIDDSKLLARGECAFEIISAVDTKSQAGNDMIELEVRVTRNGQSRTLPDYLLPQRPQKLRNCCLACGLDEQYQQGRITAALFPGKQGQLRIGVEKAKNGFGPKNVITDYLS